LKEIKEQKMIEVESNKNAIRCTIQQYIDAKTKDLREFGYTNLDQKTVRKQLDLVLAGKPPTDVIGHFIADDNPKEVE